MGVFEDTHQQKRNIAYNDAEKHCEVGGDFEDEADEGRGILWSLLPTYLSW